MAYVRKTDTEWEEIKKNINNMFVNRVEHASDWWRYGLDKIELDRRCLDNTLPLEERELLNKLGSKFFSIAKEFDVKIAFDGAHSGIATYKVPLPPNQYMPGSWTDRWQSSPPTVTDPEVIAVAKARNDAIKVVSFERDQFLMKVKKLWDAAVSVNDFVKTWPAGRDLLSRNARAKLDEKSERAKAAEKETAQINTDELSVHMLRAKVAS